MARSKTIIKRKGKISKSQREILRKIEAIPPQNIEAEQAVLGSLLLDKDALLKISDILKPEDFYRQKHTLIYEAILDLFEKHIPVDVLTITESLEKKGKFKEVGGASYLATLANSVPSSAHVANYARIVADKAALRRLIASAAEIEQLAYSSLEGELDKILDKAESILFSVSKKYTSDNFVLLKDALEESFERIDRLHREKDALRGVPTGFADLDNILSGLQKSDLIVLAARPSMGKTSLALNVAEYAAVEENIPICIFSLEMSKDQLIDRLLSTRSRVDSWKLRTGNLSEDDFKSIGRAMGILSEAPIYIDDTPAISVMEIRTKARRLLAENKIGLVIVDYLQLMEGRGAPSSEINRVQEISDISRALKSLARELNIPVLAISQLSRAVEQRSPQIPQLSDLRESGSIEQDADVVIFIYREGYYDRDSERKNIADILVKKHRNGPVGEIELYFAAENLQFRNLEKKHQG